MLNASPDGYCNGSYTRRAGFALLAARLITTMRSMARERKDHPEWIYRPGRRGVSKHFGQLEGRVMELVWQKGSATVREVHRALARQRDVAYTTIMTVMSRLHQKGFLARETEGNAFRYHPTASREEFLANATLTVFSGLTKDLSGPVMSAFVDKLGADESRRLEELAKLIESKRKKRGRGK